MKCKYCDVDAPEWTMRGGACGLNKVSIESCRSIVVADMSEWKRKAEFAAENYRRRNLDAQRLETALRQAKDALMMDAGKHAHTPGSEDPRVNMALDAIVAALET